MDKENVPALGTTTRVLWEGHNALSDILTLVEAAALVSRTRGTLENRLLRNPDTIAWRRTNSGILIYKPSLWLIYEDNSK